MRFQNVTETAEWIIHCGEIFGRNKLWFKLNREFREMPPCGYIISEVIRGDGIRRIIILDASSQAVFSMRLVPEYIQGFHSNEVEFNNTQESQNALRRKNV